MLRVGLTGGIACGKSNVLRNFAKLGAWPLDADQLAREVVEPGRPAYNEIVKRFGHEVVLPDQRIDRPALGKLIFSDAASREDLNQIIHPYIIAEEERRIESYESQGPEVKSPMIVVDAALMIETGTYKNYQLLVVVYCPPDTQLRRLMKRNELSEQAALERIKSQMPLLEKVKRADYVVDTTGAYEETFDQVAYIFREMIRRHEAGEFQ